MGRCHHDHEVIARHNAGVQIGRIIRSLDESDVGPADPHDLGNVPGVAHLQRDGDVRVGRPESAQPPRHEVLGHGHAGGDAQVAPPLRPHGRGPEEQIPHSLEHRLAPLHDRAPGACEASPTGRPVQEFQVECPFQRSEPRARCRLTDVVCAGGLPD
jgi:hypothetical protein